MFNKIVNYFIDTERELLDWIVFSVDVAIATIVAILLLIALCRHVKKKVLILGLIGYAVLFTAAFTLDLLLLKIILFSSNCFP